MKKQSKQSPLTCLSNLFIYYSPHKPFRHSMPVTSQAIDAKPLLLRVGGNVEQRLEQVRHLKTLLWLGNFHWKSVACVSQLPFIPCGQRYHEAGGLELLTVLGRRGNLATLAAWTCCLLLLPEVRFRPLRHSRSLCVSTPPFHLLLAGMELPKFSHRPWRRIQLWRTF